MKYLFLLILATFYSCSKPTVEVAKESYTLEVAGVSNFGKIILGQSRTTFVKLSNNTKKEQKTPPITPECLSNDTSNCPFSIISNNCGTTIQPGATCGASVSFAPTKIGNFKQFIDSKGFNLSLEGRGVNYGSLSVTDKDGNKSWNIGPINNGVVGDITAGDSYFKDFNITNQGGSKIAKPIVSSNNAFYEEFSDCESFIDSDNTCTIRVKFVRREAKEVSEDLQFISDANTYDVISTHSKVVPAEPYGPMTFTYDPTIIANGSDIKTISLTKISDRFGNKIEGIFIVKLSVGKVTIVNNGNSIETYPAEFVNSQGNGIGYDQNITTNTIGEATFKIKSSALKNNISLSATLLGAFGDITIRPISGMPAGITIKPFLTTMRADGTSTVSVQTEIIRDSNGFQVEDGTQIYFYKNGLMIESLRTFQGIVYTNVTSPSSVGSDVIYFKSADNNISSSASTINYVPGFPDGLFEIASSNDVIYYKTDLSGLKVDFATITVGPLKDSFGQNVGPGYPIKISIYNGWKRGSFGITEFIVNTDSSSTSNFDIEANGFVGDIRIGASLENVSTVYKKVHASSDKKIKYDINLKNNLSLYKSYGPMLLDPATLSSGLNPNDDDLLLENSTSGYKWNLLTDASPITEIDNDLIGSTTYTSNVPLPIKNTSGENMVIPKLLGLDCIQNIKDYTGIFPCFQNKKFYSSPELYINGRALWGNTDLYVIGKDGSNVAKEGGDLLYENQLGNPQNHGTYNTIFPTSLYVPESDSFFTYGGLQYKESFGNYSLEYNSTTSIYTGAVNTSSSFDKLSYSRESTISHQGIFISSTTESTSNGKFIYGGFKKYTEANGFTIDNTISRVFYNVSSGVNEFEKVVIQPDSNGNSPDPKLLPGFFYDDSDDNVYLIGGLKKSGLSFIPDGTVWKFNFKASPRKWIRVTSDCGIQPLSIPSSFYSMIAFPYWSSVNQTYLGLLDASTPGGNIATTPSIGDYYRISKSGTRDFNGTGAVSYAVGDEIIFNGDYWTIFKDKTWATFLIAKNFEKIQDYIKRPYVYKSNDGNVYMVYEGSGGNSAWKIDLKNVNTASCALTAPDTIKQMSNMIMLKYNKYSGRLFGLSRNSANDTSSISFFETDISQKQYYLGKFYLSSTAKNDVLELKFNVSAFGFDGVNPQKKVTYYLFNFLTKKYDSIGESTNSSEPDAKLNPKTLKISAQDGPAKYVSTKGYSYLMIVPGGSGGANTVNQTQSLLRINSIQLEGVW